jgi:hypothetical protein
MTIQEEYRVKFERIAAVDAARSQARLEEREACAELAESYPQGKTAGAQIAKLIRERTIPTQAGYYTDAVIVQKGEQNGKKIPKQTRHNDSKTRHR